MNGRSTIAAIAIERSTSEWRQDAHARSATNRHFLNLYEGTNWQGEPEQGWGLLSEYPEAAGVCTACHAPAVPLDQLAVGDLRQVEGVAREGVHCDFCHKVQQVRPETIGMAHGRFGMELLRPEQGQVFFGPLDDVDVGTDSHLPLQSESLFCAACHEGVIFGVHAYSTYSEWLASPDRGLGRTCQSCHMRPTGQLTNIAPGAGGIERDPQSLASHAFLPGGLASMLARLPGADADARSIVRRPAVVRAHPHAQCGSPGPHRLHRPAVDPGGGSPRSGRHEASRNRGTAIASRGRRSGGRIGTVVRQAVVRRTRPGAAALLASRRLRAGHTAGPRGTLDPGFPLSCRHRPHPRD